MPAGPPLFKNRRFTVKTIHIRGVLVVLGAGGAFLELGESYAIGSVLRLQFFIPQLGDIDCQVIVRNGLEEKGVGTEFLEMNPPDQERINHFIEQIRRSINTP